MFYQYVKYQSKTILLINITTYLFSKIASLAQSGERQTEDLKVPSSILGDRIYFLTGHFFCGYPAFYGEIDSDSMSDAAAFLHICSNVDRKSDKFNKVCWNKHFTQRR